MVMDGIPIPVRGVIILPGDMAVIPAFIAPLAPMDITGPDGTPGVDHRMPTLHTAIPIMVIMEAITITAIPMQGAVAVLITVPAGSEPTTEERLSQHHAAPIMASILD